MAIPTQLRNRLRMPAIAAPMFLVSGPDLVVQACTHGVIGAFPSLNQRTSAGFKEWLTQIRTRLEHFESKSGKLTAPYAVNLMVHRSNTRFEEDLEITIQSRVPLVITSLGAVPDLVRKVHDYGGLTFHAVTTVHHAKKAVAAGVDGLVLVCAGAGGHAGVLSPFALIPEVKEIFGGTIILAGSISTGQQILAAEALGADMVYLGTRFLATDEALCSLDYKRMVVESRAEDIVLTSAFTGVPANYLLPSVVASGFDPEKLSERTHFDMKEAVHDKTKAVRSIWSAGQGCGSVSSILPTAVLCERLEREYQNAREKFLRQHWGAEHQPKICGEPLGLLKPQQ